MTVFEKKRYVVNKHQRVQMVPPKPKPITMSGQGKRMNQMKRMDERKVAPEERVARLVRLAHEHGPQKLLDEIDVHKRKIRDLQAAVDKYNEEMNDGS